ncbi:helix-turn-helix transcriptional regulator [Couchioplanes caeruleus]|uniref:helix-turn-helix transcriptional regulator n=1 Tax=Couchioplanes caeruleus TaxID=56438 RepID=UPI0020BF56F2|nr:helix-turn-helix domain-containing protein [Couchioplanes caeruleus]UQU64488.1 helix-turn-helix transcriptional regulator [Couchioplanes caeruleus]
MRVDRPSDLGNHLREVRRRAGLSQAAVAARAGLSRRWLSDLEAGKATAEVGLVLKLVAALDLMLEINPAPKSDIGVDVILGTFDRPR